MNRPGAFPIAFAVTPRFDVFYALYTISNNAPSSLDPWKKHAVLRLPRDFDRVARRVAPVPIFWPLFADALQATIGEMTFDEIISALREMPAEDLRANVLSGIFHDAGTVQALVTHNKSLRQALTGEKLPAGELLTQFGLKPYDARSPAVTTMATLLSDPESFRNELALVIERFWQTGFRRDWSALEAILRAESFRMRDLQEEQPLAELANELKLPVTLDDQKKEVRPKSGSSIAYDRIDRCYIIPSAFNTRRWWAKYTTRTGRVSLYFPIMKGVAAANGIVADDWATDDSSRGSGINAESVFRALGDTTRYAIASILARTPTTSAELARSLKVSKPTITHHVQALRAAGLIAETPSGGSTMLSLSRETVGALSGAAVEQLFSSTGDLPLLTTRKRRNY
jgi:DNA-binding transcriptional ArsR family regulator